LESYLRPESSDAGSCFQAISDEHGDGFSYREREGWFAKEKQEREKERRDRVRTSLSTNIVNERVGLLKKKQEREGKEP
jgi:hypothetical protein